MGATAGGAVYSPAMTDFVFMVKKTSHMFITGPDVIKSVTGEEVDFDSLGGAITHCTKSGVAHFACEDDADCIARIKTLLSYLPANNMEAPPMVPAEDPIHRLCPELDSLIPDNPVKPYDMFDLIRAIADDGTFFEPHSLFAANIITCFIRMGGRTVGVIANQPKILAGCLDINTSDKASRFVRFCDAFNIPILTIADVPGFLPGTQHLGASDTLGINQVLVVHDHRLAQWDHEQHTEQTTRDRNQGHRPEVELRPDADNHERWHREDDAGR